MRQLPHTIPSLKVKQSATLITRSFTVCTPVFGGGVFIDKQHAYEKHIDPVTPVRVSSIIGQLRFWWRAIEGVRYPTLEALREAEGLLWGTSERPGYAQVWVEGQPKAKKTEGFNGPKGELKVYAYGVFPLENTKDRKKEGGHLTELTSAEGGAPDVTLLARLSDEPEAQAQRDLLELVIDAWLHFGGVGGRTRRGFGAVAPSGDDTQDPHALLQRVAARAPSSPIFHPLVPTLHHPERTTCPLFLSQRLNNAKGAHTSGLTQLSAFRQGKKIGRREGSLSNRPGRSYWPEPDEIRRLTGRSSSLHNPINKSRGFPRARFGMPVITQFKDKEKGDPTNSEVRPKGKQRMASPLILRPCKRGSNANSYALLALYLHVPTLSELPLEMSSDRRVYPVSMRITGEVDEVPALKESKPYDERVSQERAETTPDAVLAFLNFLKNHA